MGCEIEFGGIRGLTAGSHLDVKNRSKHLDRVTVIKRVTKSMAGFLVRNSVLSLAVVSTMFGCARFAQDLNQGLEDEKSYTRHAMEAYRKNPGAFRGDKSVLDTWSRSDYIAVAVAQQRRGGNWAEASTS